MKLTGKQKQIQEHYNSSCSENKGCGLPLSKVQILSGQTVLDLGCGAGIEAIEAAKQVGSHGRVLGIDMSPAMLDLARANAERAELKNIEFIEGVIEDIPVSSGCADVVISNCVVNLACDKFAVLKEAKRVLKSDGQLALADIIAVCESGSTPNIMLENAAYILGCLNGILFEGDYFELLLEAGFESPRIEIIKKYPFASFIIKASEKGLNDLLNTLDEALIDESIASAYVIA